MTQSKEKDRLDDDETEEEKEEEKEEREPGKRGHTKSAIRKELTEAMKKEADSFKEECKRTQKKEIGKLEERMTEKIKEILIGKQEEGEGKEIRSRE